MTDVLTDTATGAIRCRGRNDVPVAFRPPAPPRHFVGRENDLAAIRPGGVTVLSGPSGVGKTALALKWLYERRCGDQVYIDLGGYEPAEVVLGRLLAAFGLRGVQADERPAVFRSMVSRRQLTLLLDNAESADQVTPLLPASGTVVIVSRVKLGLDGAREIDVAPLTDDETLKLLEVLDLSYVELPARQARLYRLCARHPGTQFDVPLAAAIAGEPECDVEDALDDLVEKSLLTEVGDGFRFHDLVRAHARTK